MKKRIYCLIALAAIMIMTLLALASCGGEAKYKVNFIVDGEVYKTVETVGGEIISIPVSPAKAGYDFGGWYFDDVTFEDKFSANSLLNAAISDDINVYAKWNENTQTCQHVDADDDSE